MAVKYSYFRCSDENKWDYIWTFGTFLVILQCLRTKTRILEATLIAHLIISDDFTQQIRCKVESFNWFKEELLTLLIFMFITKNLWQKKFFSGFGF